MIDDYATCISVNRRMLSRATEMLLGMVTGMIADKSLHDLEIQMLRNWLLENEDVATTWPGSVIAASINDVVQDGIISEPEREHLLGVLTGMASNNFAQTGASSAEVISLPYDLDVKPNFRDKSICLTGEFMFGTRSKCEAVSQAAGAYTVAAPSKKTNYLVVGYMVSQAWAHTSYGRKIERAMELKSEGHGIAIITEEMWLQGIQN